MLAKVTALEGGVGSGLSLPVVGGLGGAGGVGVGGVGGAGEGSLTVTWSVWLPVVPLLSQAFTSNWCVPANVGRFAVMLLAACAVYALAPSTSTSHPEIGFVLAALAVSENVGLSDADACGEETVTVTVAADDRVTVDAAFGAGLAAPQPKQKRNSATTNPATKPFIPSPHVHPEYLELKEQNV